MLSSDIETIKSDILVVGAGPSGIPAAIAAARCGAKVVLIEEDMFPGGAAVDMYVGWPCGGPRKGIYQEMLDRLTANHDLRTPEAVARAKKEGIVAQPWFLPSSYAQVHYEMISEEKNLTLICGVHAIDAITADEGNYTRVKGVLAESDGIKRVFEAQIIIDATGTGLIAEKSGCEFLYGRDGQDDFNEPFTPEKADNKVQLVTLMYISQKRTPGKRIDLSQLSSRPMDPVWGGLSRIIKEGLQDAFYEANCGIGLHWGGTVECKDTRDPFAIAEAHREAFLKTEQDRLLLKEAGYVLHYAPRIGIRETRRILGEYVITANDLINGKMPEDVVALDGYPFDTWGQKIPEEKKRIPLSGIPYRALIPKSTSNLLIAGKSISGTHLACSSYRVQPVVASIGQAAGTAAALAVSKNTDVRNIPIETLQSQLRGVLL